MRKNRVVATLAITVGLAISTLSSIRRSVKKPTA